MDIQLIRNHLKKFELQPLFVHGLGWNHHKKKFVGIIKKTSDYQITIFFIGIAQTVMLDKDRISYLNTDKTGKNYKYLRSP